VRILRQTSILVGLGLLGVYALVGGSGMARADSPTSTDGRIITASVNEATVVIVGSKEDTWNCSKASAERARWLADKASHDSDFQRAGECYLAAGQPGMADAAFFKAAGQTGADTSRKLASNAEQVKAQARLFKQAFQRR
jgi:hypothetical protein